MFKKIRQVSNNVCIWASISAATFVSALLAPVNADARYTDGEDMIDGWISFIKKGGQMIPYLIFAVGLIGVFYGFYICLFGDERRTTKTKGVVCIGIGAAMCTAIAFIHIASGTISGEDASGLGELGIN